MATVLILYYSIHGHVFKLAQAVAEAIVMWVPEHLSCELLDSIGASEARAAQADIPVAEPLEMARYQGRRVATIAALLAQEAEAA